MIKVYFSFFADDSSVKPVFGYPLEEHLRVTGRTIAFPIELCVCTLHELALNEEGLFRIAGGMLPFVYITRYFNV